MDRQDVQARVLVGVGELYLAVNAAGPEYCMGVELGTEFGSTSMGASTLNAPTLIPPTWPLGSHQETGFNMYANHAGG